MCKTENGYWQLGNYTGTNVTTWVSKMGPAQCKNIFLSIHGGTSL